MMHRLRKRYPHTRTARRLCLIVLIVVVTVLLDGGVVFAQNKVSSTGLADTARKDLFGTFETIIQFMSWLRIVPASIAGKLMTNSMAYGSAFHLDTYLFRMWQFMRTMSLYALGFMLIGGILKSYVTFAEPSKYFDIIKKTVLAGILVSASWFILAALVDFSIIGTSAVAGIPLQVMQGDAGQRDKIKGKVWCYKKVNVNDKGQIDTNDLNNKNNINILDLEDIMPKGDSVAGPLVFMGCGLLSLNDFVNLKDTQEGNEGEALLVGAMKIILNLMMVIPMVVLMVVNMMRIFFIWMRAIFGPVIVLDLVFGGPLTKGDGNYQKYFNPTNIVGLIFQPVAVVGTVSLGMILLLGVYDSMIGGNELQRESLQEIQITTYGNDAAKVGGGYNGEAIISGSLLARSKARVGGAIGELIMAIFVIIVLRALLEIGFKSSQITSGAAGGIFNLSKKAMTSLPLIPSPFGGENLSAGALGKAAGDAKRRTISALNRRQAFGADRFGDMLGINDPNSATQTQLSDLDAASSNARGASAVNFLRALKRVQRDAPLRWNQIQPRINQWILAGGGDILRRQGILTQNYTADTINDLWTGVDGNRMRGFVSQIMQNQTLGANSGLQEFINTGRNAVGRTANQVQNQVFDQIN